MRGRDGQVETCGVFSSLPYFVLVSRSQAAFQFSRIISLLKASAFQCKHCWCGLESSLLFLPSLQLNAFAKRNNFFSFLIKYLTFCKILNYTQKLQISEIFCSTSKQLKVITDVNTFIYPVTYLFIYTFI